MKNLLTYFTLLFTLSLVFTSLFAYEEKTVFANRVNDGNLADEIYKHLSNYEDNFKIDFTGDTVNLKETLSKVMVDIKTRDRYLYENIYKWQTKYSYIDNKAMIEFKVNFLTSKEQEEFVSAHVAKVLPTLMKKTDSDLEKVKAIHDYIVLHGAYSEETTNSQYSTYTYITEEKAVCQAYALLMYKMLKGASVEVEYVKGVTGGENHAWILVKLNGEWQHIDVTWDDPVGGNIDEVRYTYFLLSDKQIAKTHNWDSEGYPTATSEKYSYFHVAQNAYTDGNMMYYKNSKDGHYYAMDLKTKKSTRSIAYK